MKAEPKGRSRSEELLPSAAEEEGMSVWESAEGRGFVTVHIEWERER